MKVSLIIATYNWPEALELCLKSVFNQIVLPDEIIIADDGSKSATYEVIENYRKRYKGKIKHLWHEDTGFRLAEIRNKALQISTGDYILQVDGDVILNSNFVRDHKVFAEKGSFVKGRRMMLGSKISQKLLDSQKNNVRFFDTDVKRREHGLRVPYFHLLFKDKGVATADAIMGSNMAFWRQDFVDVNGYNNALQGWGAEDKELAQRFVNRGLNRRKIKYGGIQYHLYHAESDKSAHDAQIKVIEDLKKSGNTRCKNGLAETSNDYTIYE